MTAALVSHRYFAVAALVLLAVQSSAGVDTRPARRPAGNPLSRPRGAGPSADYGKLPLTFEPNVGQTDARVRFLARGGGMTSFFTDTEVAMVLSRQHAKTPQRASRPEAGAGGVEQAVVRMRLVGARRPAAWRSLEKQTGISNYFIGNDPEKWVTDVPAFGRIEALGVYPGVDLVYYGNESQLEYDIVVAPGADPGQVQMAWDGAGPVRLNSAGDLVVSTGLGDIVQKRPRVYQEVAGKRVEVRSKYRLADGNRVGFELAGYDRNRRLLIDPLVLAYSTLLGGNNTDYGYGIAVDAAGAAYVTGSTNSANFPTQSAYQTTLNDSGSVFVTKLAPDGSALVYSTYLGGSYGPQGVSGESGLGIAVDAAGSAYITGGTSSADFPTTPGAFQTQLSAVTGAAFVTKLSPAGNALVYSTFLGGNVLTIGNAIAVDTAGSAYITGETTSANFPIVSGYQTAKRGSYNAFVTKLTPAGDFPVYSTFLGGSSQDYGYGIAIDAAGAAYVTGTTTSPDFPTTPSAYQTAQPYANAQVVFVTKVAPAGNALTYSTLLGRQTGTYVFGIAVDGAGSAYVTGSGLVPSTPSAYSTLGNIFVTKFAPGGDALAYSTQLGISTNDGGFDYGSGIAVDAAGSAYVSGRTGFSGFPTQSPAQATCGAPSAFVTKFAAAGNALVWSTCLGSSSTTATGIAIDAAGSAYVTGYTTSLLFPTGPLAPQASLAGAQNAFVSKLSVPSTSLSIAKTHVGSFSQGQIGAFYTLTVSNTGPAATSGTVTVVETAPLGLTLVSMFGGGWTCPGTAANNCTRSDPLSAGVSYPAITVTVNVATNAQGGVTNQAAVAGGGSGPAYASDLTHVLASVPLVPTISSLNPSSATVGGAGFALTVNGANYVTGATVNWNGTALSTTPVSATQLTATVPASLIATAGAVSVTVTTTGGTSAGTNFQVTHTPTTMTNPAPGSALSPTTTFTWAPASGATAYWLDVGTIQGQGNIFGNQIANTVTSATVSGIPANGGTIYVRLWTQFNGPTWLYNDYTYTAPAQTLATMSSPTPGSTLPGASATFTWNAGVGATAYWLDVGSIQGQGNISAGQLASTVTSKTVSGIPTTGGVIYVRLWTQFNGSTWLFNDYTYTASSPQTLAAMTSPAPGSTLSGASATFTWSAGTGATAYWLDVGTIQGQGNISAGQLASTVFSKTVSGIPTNGGAIYVRLWTQFGGSSWLHNDYVYLAASSAQTLATMSSPAPGSTLSTSATFTWSAGSGATAYWLDVGTIQGQGNISAGQLASTVTSKTVSGIPGSGAIYVRLWTQFNGSTWQYIDYAYSSTVTQSLAAISSPTPGAVLPGSTVTFSWTVGAGATAYWLDVGTVQGTGNLSAGQLANTVFSKTVSGLPTNGSTLYVRLWTQFNGSAWQYYDYVYLAANPTAATMSSPTPGLTLAGASVTFTWNAGNTATAYWLDVGTVQGQGNISAGQLANTVTGKTVSGIPTNGAPIYVRLWTQFNGSTWQFIDYAYSAF